MLSWDKLSVSLAFLSIPLGWRSERHYRQMPQIERGQSLRTADPENLTDTSTPLNLPPLSIIVPARNEAPNLRRLLPSLCGLNYPGKVEIIVVDDNSSDETALVAKEHGVFVLSLTCLEDGWLGKPNACHRGAAVAGGEWYLFTDADTLHTADGAARVVRYAINNNLDGLSSHLQHVTHGWLDGSTLTTAYAALFAGLPQIDTSLNGQYILLRRDVYEQSGGFAAVRQETMEDLALGHHLHSLDYVVPMLRCENVAEVKMYRDNRHLWRGMVRISADSLPWSGAGSLLTALFITALMTPLFAARLVLLQRISIRWFCLTWASSVIGVWPWSKRFGSRRHALWAPVGALFVQLAAVWGLLNRLAGRGLKWKGRSV